VIFFARQRKVRENGDAKAFLKFFLSVPPPPDHILATLAAKRPHQNKRRPSKLRLIPSTY
jgi:hypothetical protein